MGEIVNLRQVRKRMAREEAACLAQARRRVFGEGKAEREARLKRDALEAARLEGARLDAAPPARADAPAED